MEFIITLPFAFAGIVVFCFMEWKKFRENIKNWWAVYFAIIIFAIIVLYQYNNCRLSENTFIAGATIIGIVYSAIYNKISLENSNKSHRETLEATNKIHRDNLEFQKRIALRKERLELIEKIKKEFKEIDENFEIVWNDITSVSSPIYGNIKSFKLMSESYKILECEVFSSEKYFKKYEKGVTIGKVGHQILPKLDDDKNLDLLKYKLENLSFKDYKMETLMPFQERYDLFNQLAGIIICWEEIKIELLKRENDTKEWTINLNKKNITSMESLDIYLKNSFKEQEGKILSMREEIEIKFNAEINKLLEQSKLE